ncbi:MAG TPA: FtsH protease activity modulator HflK [Planctomycetota bacterium]|nr:FtsH protease activity modulator HflK [Planctomycetota bacterium]
MTRPTIVFRDRPDWSRLRRLFWLVPLLLFAIVLFTTYYQVPANAVGVVLRFGKYSSTQEPGLHFKMPLGVDEVSIVPTRRQLKLEFGFGTPDYTNPDQVGEEPQREKGMVTGDLNAALVEWVVQYHVEDPRLFLFHVREPASTLRDLSEAVMREIIGDRTVDEVITVGRGEIETEAARRLREMANAYELGLGIDQLQLKNVNPPREVQASFNEVNKAQQDRENMINIANGEYNKVVPRAQGEAAQKITEAEGYRLKRVNEALGDAAAFNAVLAQYIKAPAVTRTRLYLETMATVLPALASKWIVDDKVTQLLPLLQVGGKEAVK